MSIIIVQFHGSPSMSRHSSARNLVPMLVVAAALVAAMLVAGCGGASDSISGDGGGSDSGSTRLSLVAYSTPQVVYDELIPSFQKTAAGRDVGVSSSYGASGDQSRGVEAGQDADVVTFSLAPDMDRLVKAGIVSPDWDKTPSDGNVTTSLVTFVVRKGNPKGIRTWDDLLKPGVQVLTPNPFTSGSAKWNLLAAYGANGGLKDQAAGLAYVRKLLTEHVKVQDKSAREALQSFTSGNGDVLLSYENEAITAQKKGQDVDYVTPDATIKIENPIAITSTSTHPDQATAFLAYALSPPAQQLFASWGYRPVAKAVLEANAARFPVPADEFTVADLGGWSRLNDALFDPDKGAITKIEEDAGVSTEK